MQLSYSAPFYKTDTGYKNVPKHAKSVARNVLTNSNVQRVPKV